MTSSGQTPEVQRCGPLALVARGVAKSFGDGAQRADILHDVNLVVPRGQTVFLVGPSGSGKTTLLSILGCLLTPNRGSLQLLGHDVTHLSADERTAFRRQHLSFVFQNFHLFPTLSALDNLCLTLTMQGLDYAAAARRAAELLERVELRHRSHLRPGQLSTGECQRVAIARALANDPAMLLADEPTASLDAEKGLLVVELLRDAMRRHGGTLLI
ncbi:MAG: ABC transporter ATP-binding protein, partial [Planctomycetia bacterium]|nr:ABC transporter ATP-binding protein [Planctomycetia bacterium]